MLRRDGTPGSVWLRKSRTEPGVVRLVADSPGSELAACLLDLGQNPLAA